MKSCSVLVSHALRTPLHSHLHYLSNLVVEDMVANPVAGGVALGPGGEDRRSVVVGRLVGGVSREPCQNLQSHLDAADEHLIREVEVQNLLVVRIGGGPAAKLEGLKAHVLGPLGVLPGTVEDNMGNGVLAGYGLTTGLAVDRLGSDPQIVPVHLKPLGRLVHLGDAGLRLLGGGTGLLGGVVLRLGGSACGPSRARLGEEGKLGDTLG